MSVGAGQRPWALDVPREDAAYQARLFKVAVEESKKRDWVCGLLRRYEQYQRVRCRFSYYLINQCNWICRLIS